MRRAILLVVLIAAGCSQAPTGLELPPAPDGLVYWHCPCGSHEPLLIPDVDDLVPGDVQCLPCRRGAPCDLEADWRLLEPLPGGYGG